MVHIYLVFQMGILSPIVDILIIAIRTEAGSYHTMVM